MAFNNRSGFTLGIPIRQDLERPLESARSKLDHATFDEAWIAVKAQQSNKPASRLSKDSNNSNLEGHAADIRCGFRWLSQPDSGPSWRRFLDEASAADDPWSLARRFGSRTHVCIEAAANDAKTSRRVDVDQLIGAAEIADRLGVSNSQVIHLWRGRHPDFPEPITKLKIAMIWYWPDVEKWALRTSRLTKS